MFLAGGGVTYCKGASKAFTELVGTYQIPVVTTIMGRGAIPTTHPLLSVIWDARCMHPICSAECTAVRRSGIRFNDRITGKKLQCICKFAEGYDRTHITITGTPVDILHRCDAKEAIEKLLEYVEPMEKKES